MAKVSADYNNIKWEEHYYLDDKSPSGLSRKKDTYTGKGHKQLRYKAGSVVGSAQSNKGIPKGWIVELDRKPYKVHRILLVMIQGSVDADKVVDHLDGNPFNNELQNLIVKTHKGNAHNTGMYSNNTSGIKGVHLACCKRGFNTWYTWTATWYKSDKRKTTKSFSIAKHGYETAKQLAIEHRNLQIQLLNAAGASYTPRHTGLTPVEPPATPSVQPT